MKRNAEPKDIELHGLKIPRASLQTHLVILGASGSGKTNAIIKQVLRGCLAQGDAAVVFDPKGDLLAIVREALARCGRTRDLITLGIGDHDHTYNPLGDKSLTAHQIVQQLLMASTHTGQALSQRTGSEDLFWATARTELLVAMVDVTMQTLAGSGEALTFRHLQKLRSNFSQPATALNRWAKEVGELLSENSAASLLEFSGYPDSTRACVLASATNVLAPFQRPPLSQFVLPSPQRPALNLPDVINASKVLVISASHAEHAQDLWPGFLLLKQNLYRLILSRPRLKIRQDNHLLVVLDEYTRMMLAADVQASEHVVMEAARSSKTSFVLAAQNLSGLEIIGGHAVVDKLAALASNFCFLQNTCPATARLAQRVLGVKKTFKRHESITTRLPPPLLFPDPTGLTEPTVTSTMLVPNEEPVVSPSELAQLKPGDAHIKLLDGSIHRIQCTFD